MEEGVRKAIGSGDPAIFLGGDHAITHPIMRAIHQQYRELTIVHIDAHPDIYDAYRGNRRSHTSPFARIMEESLTTRLVQIGLRTVNDHHREQFARFGVEAIEARHWHGARDLHLKTPVYVSLDIDALDRAFAPGVAHPEPGGLTTREVIEIIQSLDQPIIAGDIVEYNPALDPSNMTASVAAKLVKELAGSMLSRSTPAERIRKSR